MKELLIITSYFPPETGAASNRIAHLAEGLQKKNFNVSVIAPLPNYPTGEIFPGYEGKFAFSTKENDIQIHRLWISASNSKNKLWRLFSMISYSLSLMWYFLWNKIPKQVIVQSPPLLVAFTCMLFLRSKKRRLILNVSDLWPIAGLELGAFQKNFSYRLLEKIEKFNYNNADLVMGQSEEILSHVKSMFPNKETFLYRNYPDFETHFPLNGNVNNANKIRIVYAGLLGIAQGIFKLCESLDYNGYEFHIYGTGAERQKIETYMASHTGLPIFYHGEVTRKELHQVLLEYDLTIIPLLKRIYGSVPSKIFEYAKLGLPILYFGGGEGESIIINNKLGWTAEAGNYKALNRIISSVNKDDLNPDLSKQIKQTANECFNFEQQLQSLEKHL